MDSRCTRQVVRRHILLIRLAGGSTLKWTGMSLSSPAPNETRRDLLAESRRFVPPLCLPLQPSQLIRSSPLYDHFHMTIRDHPHPPLLSRTITDHWSILPPSFAPFHCPPPQASDFDWTNESWTKCSSGEIISEAVVALVN